MYYVPQNTPAIDDTLHAQQTSLYLLDRKINLNTRNFFSVIKENQGIILLGDFNETIGDDRKMMAKVSAAGRLRDVDAHKYGHG